MSQSSKIFKALSDPTRMRLANLLAQRGPGICVCDLVEVLQLPQSTISRQIAPLRTLGLVQARRAGTWMLYGLTEDGGPASRVARASLDAAAAAYEDLKADVERFDLLKRRRELACCDEPVLIEAAREGAGLCCSVKEDADSNRVKVEMGKR